MNGADMSQDVKDAIWIVVTVAGLIPIVCVSLGLGIVLCGKILKRWG